MRRRSRLAALFVALAAVGWTLAGAQPADVARAGDPLSDAKAKQTALLNTLSAQRAKLAQLRSTAAELTRALANAKAQVASVSAEYDRVSGILAQVRQDVADVQEQLDSLNDQIAQLTAQLNQVAAEIVQQTAELAEREALLQDHLRTAYTQSQTSFLEVLLSARSLDDATNQVGYLLTVSDQDKSLADEIKRIREELKVKQQELTEGRAAVAEARDAATAQHRQLLTKRNEIALLQRQLGALKKRWEAEQARQQAALAASAQAQGTLSAQIKQIQAAASAQAALVQRLQAEQIASRVGPGGFRWPEVGFVITQYYGPTSFTMEPSYAGYAHFHTGLDMASGCGSPIYASASGVVAASGQPLYPYDPGYGVIINHGGGIQTWYWHLQARVIVYPGQSVTRGQVIGYEGATGFATGCHLHFAVNVDGAWRNPLSYLP